MLAKEVAKTILSQVAPHISNRRFIRINTLVEAEISLLPLLCRNGMLAIDIGANKGLYVHHLLAVTDKVVAFEPLLQMQRILRRVYGERIRLEGVALSSEAGTTELRFPEGMYPLATLEQSNDLTTTKSHSIFVQPTELRTLDSYRFNEVGVIKIDVEGHEEAVIKGGYDTIKINTPCLIIEIEERHKKGAIDRVYDMLKELDYDGFYIADRSLHSIDTFSAGRDQSIDNVGPSGKIGRYINNFIFVPRGYSNAFRNSATDLLTN